MNIKIIQSGKGDCLLINSGNKHVLIDGGVSSAYNLYGTKELSALQKQNISIDLACVSHIDDDHIGGFLKMIEDLVEWRVYDYQVKIGNEKAKKPKVLRPCEIKEIWHNAFHEIQGDNTGEIEKMLAATATILAASSNEQLLEMAEIAYGEKQAIQLSRRLKPDQLNIPINKPWKGKFVMFRKTATPVKVGKLKITVIAPFKEDLEKLRLEWDAWLDKSKVQIKKVRTKVDRDSGLIASSETPDLVYYQALAKELEPELMAEIAAEAASGALGKRSKITIPNLASIMFMVEEGKKKALMTGDGHADDIIKGLEGTGMLKPKKGLHIDVLKVQHHGAEFNIHEEFCRRITADHYIFCGNGLHQNPDLKVIEAIVDSRTSTDPKVLAITTQAANPFTFWFNSSPDSGKGEAKKHMKKLKTLVEKLAKAHTNLKFKFIKPNENFMSLVV